MKWKFWPKAIFSRPSAGEITLTSFPQVESATDLFIARQLGRELLISIHCFPGRLLWPILLAALDVWLILYSWTLIDQKVHPASQVHLIIVIVGVQSQGVSFISRPRTEQVFSFEVVKPIVTLTAHSNVVAVISNYRPLLCKCWQLLWWGSHFLEIFLNWISEENGEMIKRDPGGVDLRMDDNCRANGKFASKSGTCSKGVPLIL